MDGCESECHDRTALELPGKQVQLAQEQAKATALTKALRQRTGAWWALCSRRG